MLYAVVDVVENQHSMVVLDADLRLDLIEHLLVVFERC